MSILKNEEEFLFLKKIDELGENIFDMNLLDVHKTHFNFLNLDEFMNYILTKTNLKIDDKNYFLNLENNINLENIIHEFNAFYPIKNKMISHTYEEFIDFCDNHYPEYRHITQRLFTTRVMRLFGYIRNYKYFDGKKIYYFD